MKTLVLKFFAIAAIIILIPKLQAQQKSIIRTFQCSEYASSDLPQLAKSLKYHKVYRLPTKAINDWFTSQADNYRFSLAFEHGPTFVCNAVRNPILAVEAINHVATDDSPLILKGVEAAGGEVRLTWWKETFVGFFKQGNETWYIEPADYSQPSEKMVIYRASDILPSAWGTCATLAADVLRLFPSPTPSLLGGGNCLQIVTVADYAEYQDHQSNTNSFLASIVNMAEANFSPFSTTFAIVQQYVANSGNPWTVSTDHSTYLNSFDNWANTNLTVSHDMRMIFTGIDLNGTVVGATWVGSICSPTKSMIVQDDQASTALLRVITAHELGHGYNANHDAANSGYIMQPTTNTAATQFSSTSTNAINAFQSSNSGCLACAGGLPNDGCSQATSLTSSTNCNFTSGTVSGATSSGISIPSCSGFTSPTALDVWFSFEAQATTHEITVDPSNSGSAAVDAVIGIYDACNNSGFIECCDPSGGGGATATCSFSGLTVGNIYYIRLFDYGSQAPTYPNFQICVTHTSAPLQHDFLASNLSLNNSIFADGDPIAMDVDQCTASPNAAAVTVHLEYTLRTTSGTLIQQLGTDNSSLGNGTTCNSENRSTSFPSGVPVGPCQICAEANYDLALTESNTSNNRICEAITVIGDYEIILSANPPAGGTVSGAGFYGSGTSITVTATPNPNWSFVNWTENGNTVSNIPNYSFTVNADRTLEANFTQSPQNFNIQVTAVPTNGGTVTGGGSYAGGSTVNIAATPNSGWYFVDWTENGNQVSINPNYSFNINSNRSLDANFAQTPPQNFNVQLTMVPANGGTVTGGGTYSPNSTVNISATPNTGWAFDNWTENGAQVSSNASYSFTISSNRFIEANFSPIGIQSYIIQSIPNPTTGGSVLGAGTYLGGIQATLYATPNNGWQLLNWMENSLIVATTSPYTFMVNADRTLVANFTPVSTSVDRSNQLQEFEIFPNPNNGSFTIRFPSAGMRRIDIFDALGRKVFAQEMNGNSLVHLELNLAPSTYFVKVADKKENATIKPVIVH